MEVSYKRDMNHTYLILQGGEKVDTSAYPVRMMLSNQWETFLPCTIQGMDNQVLSIMTSLQDSHFPVCMRQGKRITGNCGGWWKAL